MSILATTDLPGLALLGAAAALCGGLAAFALAEGARPAPRPVTVRARRQRR